MMLLMPPRVILSAQLKIVVQNHHCIRLVKISILDHNYNLLIPQTTLNLGFNAFSNDFYA
jgi:hypothetical protein